MALPLYYEFRSDDTSSAANCYNANNLEFKYADNFKNIFDLYINNSCTDKNLLGENTVEQSMAEFAAGKCAMVQNGSWAWYQISRFDSNVVKEEDIGFLPIYTGVDGEESQGICVGTENYFAINSKIDDATKQASVDFLYWLFTSDYGKKAVTQDLGFIAPFSSFGENERPSAPLAKDIADWLNKNNCKSVEWTFQGIPSENWKKDFGASLLEYAQGGKDWSAVVDEATKSWTTERQNADNY